MNSSEINNLVTLLGAVLAPLAAKYGIDNTTIATITGSAVSLGFAIWGVYSHWNMTKVPEKKA